MTPLTQCQKKLNARYPVCRLTAAIRQSILGVAAAAAAINVNSQSLETFPSVIELSALNQPNGVDGVIISGINASDQAGREVSNAGDVNGDGVDDVLIGANFADQAADEDAGEAYLVFGSSQLPVNIELSALNQQPNSNGVRIKGFGNDNRFGSSLSSAGDINNDGLADFAVNSSLANGSRGVTYLIYGSSALPETIELSSFDSTSGTIINGIETGDRSGFAIDNAGDINADGIDDLIIGARLADPGGRNAAGESYVIFGSSNLPPLVELSDLNQPGGINGVLINGVSRTDESGYSVSHAGDINSDNIPDIIIGARFGDSNGSGDTGEAYIIYGGSNLSGTIELSNLSQAGNTGGIKINGIDVGDQAGFSVSDAGDVNDDGFDDALIGAFLSDPNGNNLAGESYVIFGGTDLPNVINLSALNTPGNADGVIINGANASDISGRSVSSAGDVNDDGIADFLVSADGADPNNVFVSGQVYIVFGTSTLPNLIESSLLSQPDGVVINGPNFFDAIGFSLSNAGDFNGDGLSDIIIGTRGDSNTGAGTDGGEGYIIFGSGTFFTNGFESFEN